jgi:hypothetical protein
MKIPVLRMVAALTLLGASSGPAWPATEPADEYEVRAAMYVNILRLVDWPAGKLSDPAEPLVIGVADQAEMARALEALARSAGAPASRKIVVRRLAGPDGASECLSVFVGGQDRKRIGNILGSLAGSPVLTVGEDERFMSAGGMVGLVLRDDKVQIEVNLDLARQSGLVISSRLLRIATVNKRHGK